MIANSKSETTKQSVKTIYLAGGCFWGMQSYFEGVQGVVTTVVGYANANRPHPRYEDVDSDYAETLQVDYNESICPLTFLLELYFDVIDPTSLNKQGGDVGRQYRTGIYYVDEEDAPIIKDALDRLALKYTLPIVVENGPLENFYPAEEYHQNYLRKNPAGYCHIGRAKIVKVRNAKYIDKEALRARLSEMQYFVTQEKGTEPPFRNEYYDHYERGIYVDVVDGTPLFLSSDKFESGCGWPAFSAPIDVSALNYFDDYSHGMERVEVTSKSSGAHLGHLFQDAPVELGGERYCINSAALRFIPIERMEEEGYAHYMELIN